MERTEERDDVLPLGVIASQLQRRFDCFGTRVAEIDLVRARHGRDLREPFGQRDHALVVEVSARHVDQFRSLPLNGSDHVGMAVAGGSHGDAGGKIKKLVAIHVRYHDSASLLCDKRIRTGIGRRNVSGVACEHALGDGAGQSGLNLGTDGNSLGRHGILRKVCGLWSVASDQSCWPPRVLLGSML